MARKGENIFYRKDGRWEARYVKSYRNGRIVYGYLYGKTYSEAKRKKELIRIQLDKKEKKSLNSELFLDYVNNWLKGKSLFIKETSLVRYKGIIDKHIIPYIHKCKCSDIDDDFVVDFIQSKQQQKLSPKTIKDIVVLLKQICKYARIKININAPKVRKKTIIILNKEEQRKLEYYLFNNLNTINVGILLSLYTGLRIGEICALKWSNIDLLNKQIVVNHSITRIKNIDNSHLKTKIIINDPKTEYSKRIIPIPNFITNNLNKIIPNNKDYYLLTNSNKVLEPRTYYNKYKKVLKTVGLEKYNYHALRHTFATRCIEVGFDPKSLMEILGHSDIKITLSLYVHPTNTLKKEYMNKLEPLL